MTVRLHANRCYPEQGGLYYRYNNTIEYGEQENEIVGTRATNVDGFLDFQIERPWEMEVSNKQSIVITSASEGILLCMNLNWTRVDGAFSSAVGMVSLLAVLGMVMKQMFLFSIYSNKHILICEMSKHQVPFLQLNHGISCRNQIRAKFTIHQFETKPRLLPWQPLHSLQMDSLIVHANSLAHSDPEITFVSMSYQYIVLSQSLAIALPTNSNFAPLICLPAKTWTR